MTPNEILNKQFGKVMSGYRMEEVNSFLADIASYVEDLIEEKDVIEQKMLVLADKLEEYREDEDSLRAALIGAQKLGDSVVRESRKKAEETLQDAQDEAERIIESAKKKAEAINADARKSIETENDTLNKLKAEVARFKGQIKDMLYRHMEILNSIEIDEKAAKPEKLRAEKPVEKQEELAPEPEPVAKEEGISLTFVEEPDPMPQAEDQSKKETRHGKLMFGEDYAIRRKE